MSLNQIGTKPKVSENLQLVLIQLSLGHPSLQSPDDAKQRFIDTLVRRMWLYERKGEEQWSPNPAAHLSDHAPTDATTTIRMVGGF